MAIDAFETYTCDVCKRKQEFERGFYIESQAEREKWRAISCSGVRISYGERYGSFSIPTDGPDPRLIKFLVCESDECLEAAFSRITHELRLSFAEEKQKFEQS